LFGTGAASKVSYPVCQELEEQREIFEGLLCRHPAEVHLSIGGAHEPARVEIVSGSYFSVLRVRPALGRLIEADDNRQPGAHPVVVLAHDYWRDRLGGAEDVVGRRVLVNNHPMTGRSSASPPPASAASIAPAPPPCGCRR
jgi:hypothetical protein